VQPGKRNFAGRDWRANSGAEHGRTAGIRFADRAAAGAEGIRTSDLRPHTTDNLQVIAGVVIGGTSLFGGSGGLTGSLIGIILPVALLNGFVVLGLPPFWQHVALGAVRSGVLRPVALLT
jgi:ABC-type xylose transport system permease subunit